MKEMRLAGKIIHTLLKDRVHYPNRLLAETFALFARTAIVLYLYSYVFRLRGGVIGDLTYQVAAWSLFLYSIVTSLRLREVTRTIMNDVRSGTVEVLFNKPISYLPYRAWWQIGNGSLSFLLITVVGTLSFAAIIGIPESFLSIKYLATTGLTFVLSVCLGFLLYAIVGLCAFWMEEINPIYWITDKAIMILGGSYLPVALFPDFMAKLARYSPIGAVHFLTYTAYDSWPSEWLVLIGIQLFWIVLLGATAIWMSQAAHRRVSINGG